MGEIIRLAKVDKKPAFTYNLTTLDAGVKFLEVVIAFVIKEFNGDVWWNVAEKRQYFIVLKDFRQ